MLIQTEETTALYIITQVSFTAISRKYTETHWELLWRLELCARRMFSKERLENLFRYVALSASDNYCDIKEADSSPLQLYHALMAFSALSMSHKHGIPSLDALQHYQQALPSLKASLHTEEDLASDGVYLTHFILLLYEIAAGTPRGIGFWSQHISQLQKIILLRRDRHGSEPYSFIVWWVACIDMHVMLSDMGKGEFLETMLRRRLLPPGIGSDAYYTPTHSLPSPTPYAALPSSLSFHRRICVLVAELALLARDLRDKTKRMKPHEPSPATRQIWQASIGVLQDTLRRTWKVQIPASKASEYCNQLLPVGARGVFEHVSLRLASWAINLITIMKSKGLCCPDFRIVPRHLNLFSYFYVPSAAPPLSFAHNP